MSDLTWTTGWESVISYDDQLLPTRYQLKTFFDIATDDSNEQNIAFDRIKFFVDNVMQDGIFCHIDDPKINFFMNNLKQKLVTFVQPPQDLTVVSHIFSKFNQIAEDRLVVQRMELSSELAGDLTINFDQEFFEESAMLFSHNLIKKSDKSPWWFRNDCGSADFFIKDSETKEITFVTDVSGWDDAGLSWPSKKEKSTDLENHWQPTVIPGGKTQH